MISIIRLNLHQETQFLIIPHKMSNNSFEQDSLSWQLQQLQQQITEWWEWQLQIWDFDTPDTNSDPIWWDSPLTWIILKGLLWFTLAVTLSWLAILIIRKLEPYFYSLQKLNLSGKNSQKPGTKLSPNHWVQKAKKYQKQGNYREACRSLYFALLQHLHETNLIQHQESRTDGEYRQLVTQIPRADPYQTILKIHEQLLFSNLEASESLLKKCQQAYQKTQE